MSLLPRTRLQPCPACSELLHAGAGRCPHCGVNLSEGTGLMCSALIASSLALSGCLVQALYGGPDTASEVTIASESSTTSGTTTGTGTTTDASGTTTAPTTEAPTTAAPTSTSTTTDETSTTAGPTTGETGTTATTSDTEATTADATDTIDEPLYGAGLSQ